MPVDQIFNGTFFANLLIDDINIGNHKEMIK